MRLMEKVRILEELHRLGRMDEATYKMERRKLLGEKTEAVIGSWRVFEQISPKLYLAEHRSSVLSELQGLRWIWVHKKPNAEQQKELAYLRHWSHPNLLNIEHLEGTGEVQISSVTPLSGGFISIPTSGFSLERAIPILEQLASICDFAHEQGVDLGWLDVSDAWLTNENILILWHLGWQHRPTLEEQWISEEAHRLDIPINQMVWGAFALKLLGGIKKNGGENSDRVVHPLALVGAALGFDGSGGFEALSCSELCATLSKSKNRSVFKFVEGASFDGFDDADVFDRATLKVDGIALSFVRIPPLESHDSGVFIATVPITQKWYQLICSENPSHMQHQNNPVESISFLQATLFCNGLSRYLGLTGMYRKTKKGVSHHPSGMGFRLPTRTEWEYAAQAGGQKNQQGWSEGNSKRRSQAVGTLSPSRWGLHDMLGNVWELVAEYSTLQGAMGGSHRSGPLELRPDSFLSLNPSDHRADVGFRVVLSVDLGWSLQSK